MSRGDTRCFVRNAEARGESCAECKTPNNFIPPSACLLSAFIPHTTMQYIESDVDELLRNLTVNFNILADEVQLLSDRKTILEHKLRFAHEQVRPDDWLRVTHPLASKTAQFYMMNNIALDLESAFAPTTDNHHVPDSEPIYPIIFSRGSHHDGQ